MSDIVLTKQFITTLARRLKKRFGPEVKHTAVIDEVAAALGWRADALMHKLKNDAAVRQAMSGEYADRFLESLRTEDPEFPGMPELVRSEKPLDDRGTVFADRIVCLEDGSERVFLKSHLKSKYGMEWGQYLAKHGLPADYPSIPPGYSQRKERKSSRERFPEGPPDGTPLN